MQQSHEDFEQPKWQNRIIVVNTLNQRVMMCSLQGDVEMKEFHYEDLSSSHAGKTQDYSPLTDYP